MEQYSTNGAYWQSGRTKVIVRTYPQVDILQSLDNKRKAEEAAFNMPPLPRKRRPVVRQFEAVFSERCRCGRSSLSGTGCRNTRSLSAERHKATHAGFTSHGSHDAVEETAPVLVWGDNAREGDRHRHGSVVSLSPVAIRKAGTSPCPRVAPMTMLEGLRLPEEIMGSVVLPTTGSGACVGPG